MANLIVDVVHPTERADGTPATSADIASWRLSWKSRAATNYSSVGGARLPSDTSARVENVPTGDYDFRVIWTDRDGQDSEFGDAQFSVGPPARLSAGTVTVRAV